MFNNSNLVFQNSKAYSRDINHLFECYLKATEDDHKNGHLPDEEPETLTPLPHQEHSDQSNDSTAISTTRTEDKEEKTLKMITKTRKEKIPVIKMQTSKPAQRRVQANLMISLQVYVNPSRSPLKTVSLSSPLIKKKLHVLVHPIKLILVLMQ